VRNSGFTLIELIIVILILGILSVTAAPRFLNLQDDARNATLSGMAGAIRSGLDLGYAKLAINGLENSEYITNHAPPAGFTKVEIPIQGCEESALDRCIFRYGYPESDFYTITTLVDGINKNYEQTEDWGITKLSGDIALIITDKSNLIYTNAEPMLKSQSCYIRYLHPTYQDEDYTLEIIDC